MSEKHVVLGTGAIGRAIAEELVARKKMVRMVNRTGKLVEKPDQAEIISADLYDPKNVRAICKDAIVVYQAAQPEYHRWVEEFPSLQASIIDGLSGSSSKLVIVENLYMYGEPNGKLTEDSTYNAHTRKGKVRAEMSLAALSAHKDGKIRVTIGRGSDYFGPWGVNSTMGGRVFYPLLSSKPANVIGRIDQPHTHTYTRDFAKALVIIGERSEADGQAWHVPNNTPQITQGELIQLIANEMGVEPNMKSMGKLMMRIGGLFIPQAKESVEMMYEFDQPFVVDSSKFEKAFGMKATPLKQAIHETVEWYKSHPIDSK